MPLTSPSSRLIPLLAWCKLTVGWVAYFFAYHRGVAASPGWFPYWLFGISCASFLLTGVVLLVGGRHDPRARHLGNFFLVTSTSWMTFSLPLALEAAPWAFPLAALHHLRPDAFMPFYLFAFARDFPTPLLFQTRRRVTVALRACWWICATLFVLNLLVYVLRDLPLPPWARAALAAIRPQTGKGLYYQVIFLLLATILAALLVRLVRARGPEGRRGRLLLVLIVASLAPVVIDIGIQLANPSYLEAILKNPAAYRRGTFLRLLPALLFFVTIPYVVLVHRVLDVRSIARRAIQHALARATVGALTVVPLAVLVLYVAVHGDQTVRELASSRDVPLLVGLAALGALGYRYRKPLLDTIDRRFFREQYDARRILTLLVERIRSVHEVGSLAHLVSHEIDLALHLDGISMLVLQPKLGLLVDLKVPSRRLDASSLLAHAVQTSPQALDVELDDPRSPLRHLQEAERRWLAASGFRLLVPILARDGALLGLVGLGDKKSGLPFVREDRELLHSIASSAAWVLELDLLHAHPWRRSGEGEVPEEPSAPALEPARECAACGLLHPPHTIFCSHCSKKLMNSHVPYVLPGGRYRFERRIGIGAMGIVYRAVDLTLHRPVAIKTLRYLSPEAAVRLRHEARTAAAVSDPHLAAVYGVETWQGTPMLALEMLEGGTLSQRIQKSPLSPLETAEIGIAMAGALARLHEAEILHRDVKPSNIGYDAGRRPKLMDFGIARAVLDIEDLSDLDDPSTEDDDPLGLAFPSAWEETEESLPVDRRRFAGTLSYLSPEALEGDPPDSSVDLWALGVVLYECLLGRKVFGGGDTKQIVARIRQGRTPDFTQVFPQADPRLAEVFRGMLHKVPARRPSSARELQSRLVELRVYLETQEWAREPLLEALDA